MRATPPVPIPAGASSLPTIRLGVDRLPTRCHHCSSTWHGYEPPLGPQQRGSLWCQTCSRTICWVAAPVAPRGVTAAPIPPLVGADAFRRTDGCGPTCTPEYGHAADVHERYGASSVHAAISARSTGDTATGPLLLQRGPSRVFVGRVEIALTVVEYQLLAYLADRLGDLCWAADLLDAVWGADWGADTPSGRHLLRVNFSRIRGKLGAAGALIETEFGCGYRLLDAPLC